MAWMANCKCDEDPEFGRRVIWFGQPLILAPLDDIPWCPTCGVYWISTPPYMKHGILTDIEE